MDAMRRNVMKTARTALVALMLVVCAASAGAAQRQVVEGILARVNDRIITITDFRTRLKEELGQQQNPVPPSQLDDFARKLFDSMIDELVLLERAHEKKITVESKDVDQVIQSLREHNKLTDDQAFKQALASSGLTEKILRERYRQTLLLQRVVQSEVKPTEITAQEVRDEYDANKRDYQTPDKVQLQQLFFKIADDGHDREDVLRRVRGLVARVRAGADLAAEATLAGVDVQDLGEIPVGDLREAVRKAVASLQPGQITEPVLTAGGYQVIRLLKRIPAGYVPFKDVEEQLRRKLSQKRYQEQTDGLVNRLKKDYLVEVHKDLFDQVLKGLGRG
jgi:peptidyl-prolyl cis-trans isomerase SurA